MNSCMNFHLTVTNTLNIYPYIFRHPLLHTNIFSSKHTHIKPHSNHTTIFKNEQTIDIYSELRKHLCAILKRYVFMTKERYKTEPESHSYSSLDGHVTISYKITHSAKRYPATMHTDVINNIEDVKGSLNLVKQSYTDSSQESKSKK